MKNFMLGLAVLMSGFTSSFSQSSDDRSVMDFNTAIVYSELQNDFLSPEYVAWRVVKKSVMAHNTVLSHLSN